MKGLSSKNRRCGFGSDNLNLRPFVRIGGALWLLLFCFAFPAHAAVWVVHPDGTGDAPTIQDAISKAEDGDTIRLGPGTYQEDLRFWGKGIILESVAGPALTILDGSQQDSAIVNLVDEEPPGTTIRGFTFRDGQGTSLFNSTTPPYGGAIYCGGPSTVLIVNNIFSDNSVYRGGAIFAWPGQTTMDPQFKPNLVITKNTFYTNASASIGGALLLQNVRAEISDNHFEHNQTRFDGGAIYATGSIGQVAIRRNQFTENKCWDKGGALFLGNSFDADYFLVENNVFLRNISRGQDFADDGTGGAIAIELKRGIIRGNTIVFNDGRGSTKESGGGLTVRFKTLDVTITHNIIAYNLGAGMSCFSLADPNTITMGPNIFWKNSGGPFGAAFDICPASWASSVIVANPLFCNPEGDDYSCFEGSPALSGPEVFGAIPDPGCAPLSPVQQTTWGKIKAMYLNKP